MIPDKANELGRLIGQTAEYQALRRAQESLQEAKELGSHLRELQRLAEGLEAAMERGDAPSEADQRAYDELLATVQSDAVYQGMVAAQANFDKLMMRVNEQMLEGMRKGSASRIITLS